MTRYSERTLEPVGPARSPKQLAARAAASKAHICEVCEHLDMPESPHAAPQDAAGQMLAERLGAVGHALGEREAPHREELNAARCRIEELRSQVDFALDTFHQAASRAGAPHLKIELGAVRVDDKHLRSVEFELVRGRHKAIVTAKSRGDVTLVGPFRAGKSEKPCLTYPFDAGCEFDAALAEFLEKFLVEAATP